MTPLGLRSIGATKIHNLALRHHALGRVVDVGDERSLEAALVAAAA